MNKLKSLYLELFRILAALYVFLFHIGSSTIGDKNYFATADFNAKYGMSNHGAHGFVIVFFVLSGFLITMSVNKPGATLSGFFIARLGRLYSVLIPALIFTYLVSYIVVFTGSIPAELISNNDHLIVRFFLNLAFLSQTWTLCSTPPLNGPFWSVAYEFIYYVAIAIFTLIKNSSLKWLLLAVLALIAFPKVLILFPAWFAGSVLYFVSKKLKMNKWLALALFVVSLTYIIVVNIRPELAPFTKNENDNKLWGFNLLLSWNYQADLIYSMIIAANIYFLFSIADSDLYKRDNQIIERLYNALKLVANCSYTLYLFHMPLMYLFTSILPYDRANTFYQIGLIIITLLSVYFIARFTEWKVDFWRSVTERIFNFFNNLFNRNLATSKV